MSELTAGIFENAVPISFEDHRHLRFSETHDYRFAAGLVEVPLAYTEWVSAARHYPVVFSRSESGLPDSANALLKIDRDAENPFLDADTGQWLPDHYIPQYLRFYPFTMDLMSPTAPVLMAVLEAPHFSNSVGEPLFDEAGEMGPLLNKRSEDLRSYLENIRRTHSLIELLHTEGLLSLSQVFRNEASRHEKLIQVVSVDQEKLSKTSPESLARLNQRGILALAYAQVNSLENLNRLDRASRAPATQSRRKTAIGPGAVRPGYQAPATDRRKRSYFLGVSVFVGVAGAFLLGSWLGPFWGADSSAIELAASQPSVTSADREGIGTIEPSTAMLTQAEPDLAVGTEAIVVADPLPKVTSEEPASATMKESAPPPTAVPVDQAEDSRPDVSSIAEAQTGPERVAEPAEPSLPLAADEAVTAAMPDSIPMPLAEPAEDSRLEVPSITDGRTELEVATENATPSLPIVIAEDPASAMAQANAQPPPAEPVNQAVDSRPEASGITEVQTGPEVVTEPAAPPLAPAVRDEIDSLLGKIQVNIQRDRLSRPADDNAINKINRIFELDPGNLDAKAAIDKVIDRYITLARQIGGWLGKTYLQTAHRLDPARLDIDNAWRDLYAPELPAWFRDN